jgi:nucleoside-specific outer membrane channel protein Tsx
MDIKLKVTNKLDGYIPFTFGQKTAKAPKCTTSNVSTTNSLEFSVTIHLNGIVPSFTYKTTKTTVDEI